MPTVKFDSGQSVNFDHPPTPQDIEEVAQKLGINKPSPTGSGTPDTSATPGFDSQPQGLGSKILQGAGKVYNSIASPLEGVAAIPFQAGLAAYNKVTGKNIPDPFAQGVPSPAELVGAGKTPVTPLKLENKVGDAAQVASLFVPGEGVLGAIGTGALQGAGSAMSEGKSAPEVATSGLLGGAVGGVVGGATKLAGAGIQKAGESISGEGAAKAVQGIKDAYGSALNLHASERAFENRSGKDLAEVLMKNKAPLARYENGTLDASQAIPILQTKLEPLDAKAAQLLTQAKDAGRTVSLTDALTQAKDRIQKMSLTQAEKNAAMKEAENGIQAEIAAYGDRVTPDVADKIKQGFWGSSFKGKLTSADKLKSNTDYLTGSALKDMIEKSVKGTGIEDDLATINMERGDLIDATKRLTAMDGVRLLKGGRVGNIAGGIVGSITGAASGLGPVGALAGDYFGTKAAQFLQDPATKIAIATGKARAQGLVPGLLGKTAGPVGKGVSQVGGVVKKGARVAGLLGNLLTR